MYVNQDSLLLLYHYQHDQFDDYIASTSIPSNLPSISNVTQHSFTTFSLALSCKESIYLWHNAFLRGIEIKRSNEKLVLTMDSQVVASFYDYRSSL